MTQAAMTFTLTGPDPLMSGLWRDLNANGFTVSGLKAPVNSNDAARKADVAAVASSLAPVATSGAYADLTGKPALGSVAVLNSGTGNGNVPVLGASGLPAVGGSLLTGITKGQVGLGNVDNTADSAKPISVLQQAALDLKAATSSLGTAAYLNTGTASGNIPLLGASGLPAVGGSLLTGLAKAQVGLANVDNTSDATKNAATATLTNKTLTAPVINSPTGIVKGDVGLGNVDNTSDATKNAATATLTNKTLTAPVINSPTGLVKADVGLGNVDNTTDAGKPISTATQTALNAKAPLNSPVLVTPTLSAHPATSDNSFLIADTKWVNDAIAGAVASGVADGDKGDIVVSGSGTVWTLDAGTASALKDRANHTGTQSADTITDGTTNKAFTASMSSKLAGVASGATANDTDANLKDRANHTGTQSAGTITGLATVATSGAYTDLSGKPTLGTAAALNTGTSSGNIPLLGGAGLPAVGGSLLTGLAKAQVGLGNVDNTADSAKPVSTAQQTALNDKASLTTEDQTLTGGANVTSKSLGTITTGTVTPDPGDRSLQHYTNNGAHTLAPGVVTGSYLLDITNGASAGAITTSGWTKVSGDAFTTTSGNKFRCHASVGSGGSLLIVQALQ